MNTPTAYLVKIEAEGFESERWPIYDKPFVIGRSKEASVILLNRKVSRVHCLIAPQANGTYILSDMHSTNGTRVNDRRLEGKEVLLQPYDRISIGDAHFIFKLH